MSLRGRLRSWLLTEREREAVERIDQLQGELTTAKVDLTNAKYDLSKAKDEWAELLRALDHADLVGEDIEVGDHDILVVAGRKNVVTDSEFGGPLYVNGKHHSVSDCHLGKGRD